MKLTISLRRWMWPEDVPNRTFEIDRNKQLPSGRILSIVRPCLLSIGSNLWPTLPGRGGETSGLKQNLASTGTCSIFASLTCHFPLSMQCCGRDPYKSKFRGLKLLQIKYISYTYMCWQ